MCILYLLTTDINVTWQGTVSQKSIQVYPLKTNLKLILLIRLFFDDFPKCLIRLSNFSVVYKLYNQHDFNFQFFF